MNVVPARLDAIAGRTLVVPIELGPRFDPRVPVPVRLGDGRQLQAQVHRVAARPEESAGFWLPPAGVWESAPGAVAFENAALEPGTLASWMLLVPLPPGAAGQSLRISQTQVTINWLSSAAGAGMVRSADEKALGPVILRIEHPTPATERLLDPERTSPARRWRYRLYTDGLSRVPGAVGERLRFSDPVLEAIATQNEDRWEMALRTIRKVNEELAQRLARRLTMVADFGSGIVAPAWPISQDDLGSLLSDLLDPRLSDARRAARAASWLDAQVPAVGWVIDDAGAQDALSSAALTTVGLADLGDREVAAFASAQAGGAQVAATIPPGVVERMLVPCSDVSRTGPEMLDLRVGKWSGAVQAYAGRLPAEPPGVSIGPLLPDYSEVTWLETAGSGRSPAPDPRWLTAGLIYRRSGAGSGGGGGGGPAGAGDWVLHFECLRPPTQDEQASSREDTVRIWIGLTGRPRLVLRIGESGYAHIESVSGSQGEMATGEAFGVTVISRPGKWVCQVPLPAVCFESDGTLRIGLERIDSRGRRSAFPRPMLPWQTEPGRMAIDISTW